MPCCATYGITRTSAQACRSTCCCFCQNSEIISAISTQLQPSLTLQVHSSDADLTFLCVATPSPSSDSLMHCCSKATKLIMFGYKMMPAIDAQACSANAHSLIIKGCAEHQEWERVQNLMQLTSRDIDWVLTMGRFKAAHLLVTHCKHSCWSPPVP